MQIENPMPSIEKPSDPSKQNKPVMAARARRIREVVAGVRLSGADQVRVAENMWRILEEAERRGVSKAKVLQAAGVGSEGDSTKRLPRFAINPDFDSGTKEKRAVQLTQTAQKYLRIAEKAGEMVESESDAYVAMLFNGTRFASAGDAVVTEDVHAELASLLRIVCAGVARKHDLQRVFRLCDERHLCRYSGSVRQNRDDRWVNLWHRFSDGARVNGLIDDMDQWTLPYPSVLIGWKKLSGGIPFAVTGKTQEGPAAHYQPGDLLLEVRLALLPLGPGGEVEPAFVTCPWTLHSFMSVPPGMDGKDCSEWAARGVPCVRERRGWTWDPGEGDAWELAIQKYEGVEPALSYWDKYRSELPVRIDLVSPESCARILSGQRAGAALTDWEASTVVDDLDPALEEMSEQERTNYWRSLYEPTLDDPESPRWRSEPGSLSETLEYSLLYAVHPERRFDAVLDRVAKRVAAEVVEALEQVDGWREQAKARLHEKWGEAS